MFGLQVQSKDPAQHGLRAAIAARSPSALRSASDFRFLLFVNSDFRLSSDERVHRPCARTGESEEDRAAQQRQRELDSRRVEEAVLQVNLECGDEHVEGESGCCKSREDTGNQGESTEQLEECNQRSEQLGHRDSQLGEAARHTVEAEYEKLLPAVRDEDRSCDDAKDSESGVDLAVGWCAEE